MASRRTFKLTPGKRVLFLTKDPDKIRRQLDGSLNLAGLERSPEHVEGARPHGFGGRLARVGFGEEDDR